MQVHTVPRPYIMTFNYAKGGQYRLSQEEVDNLLAEYPVITVTANRVVLRGDGHTTTITPATLGGGPAFIVER